MLFLFGLSRDRATHYIRLNTHLCKACWKCIDRCRNNVIKKIDILGHRHVALQNIDHCTGCLQCVRTCEQEAFKQLVDVKGAKNENRH